MRLDAVQTVSFVLNGRRVDVLGPGRRKLIHVLREEFGLTGTKHGCDGGNCGTCTVLVNGEPKLACVTPVAWVAGRQVMTIEGLSRPGRLHALQEAFIQAGAIQCGFCTPGMILAARALLERFPDPSEEEIREGLKGQLCRCTGYVRIIEAVRRAAALRWGARAPVMACGGGAEEQATDTRVGESRPLLDAEEKATGRARFAADVHLPSMLHARVLRSPHHHARIRRLDPSAALAIPGVAAVLTARDVPGENSHGRFIKNQPALCGEQVRYKGDPVAVVAADSEAVAEQALRAIQVDYGVLPAVFDPEEALRDDAPQLTPEGNLCDEQEINSGDVESALAGADIVLTHHFSSPFNDHAYLEPEAGVAFVDEEGRVAVMAPTQNPHFIQGEVARVLGLPREQVRIIQSTVGGGFGGKADLHVQALLGLLAQRLRAPVKLVYTRKESIQTTGKRHPFRMTYTLGASADGTLQVLKAEMVVNCGAYTGFSPGVITRAALHATGPYRIPHVRIRIRGALTNNPSSGAMRGFGAPQVGLAIESMLDILAGKLGMDPLELRLRNALEAGDCLPTGDVLPGSVGMRACLAAVRPHYEAMRQEVACKNQESSDLRYGLGLGGVIFGNGMTGLQNPGRARAELQGDGTVVIYTGVADMGQGVVTGLAQIAATELELPLSRIRMVTTDTALTPDSGPTCASRQTYFSGNAVLGAAQGLKQALRQLAGLAFERPVEEVRLDDGAVVVPGAPEARMSLGEFLALARERGIALHGESAFDPGTTYYDSKTGRGRPYPTYDYGVQLVEVEVNRRTGEVRVPRVVAVQDVGRAINPALVAGQLEGSVVMGLGFALMERFEPRKTHGFGNYRIPSIKDAPAIETVLVETADPSGPFGAKGVGEAAGVPTAGAVLNAIADAVGVRLFDVPVDPARLRTE
ncbi:MAG: molybdopterin-dependent oxidoreductase [Deltaproteobacteria bacterium]|nr:molybdopterin-dependent oxidoreductase [Deltaproteobacteria bacterium]MBI3078069.1 molybdopterin-dependent oxidoreductase [Deltaproteobacteria bacterium]